MNPFADEKIELFREAILWHSAKPEDQITQDEREWMCWAEKRINALKKGEE